MLFRSTVVVNDVSGDYDDGSVNLGSGDDTLTINDSLSGTDSHFTGGAGEDSLVLNNVSREDWDDGIKENFSSFENVTFSDGTTIDIASTPTLELSVGEVSSAGTNTSTFTDSTDHTMSEGFLIFSDDTEVYTLGGTTNSVDLSFSEFDNDRGRRDEADEATIELYNNDGELVDTQVITYSDLSSTGTYKIGRASCRERV